MATSGIMEPIVLIDAEGPEKNLCGNILVKTSWYQLEGLHLDPNREFKEKSR